MTFEQGLKERSVCSRAQSGLRGSVMWGLWLHPRVALHVTGCSEAESVPGAPGRWGRRRFHCGPFALSKVGELQGRTQVPH